MTVLRFPPGADLRTDPPRKPSLWARIKAWFSPPAKAEVFRIKNPTQWKLERIRRILTDQVDDAERQHPMEELMALVQPRRYNEMVQLPAAHDEAWEETTELLARVDALAERSGAETMVAYLPSGVEVCRDSLDTLARIGFERDPRTLTDTTFVFGEGGDVFGYERRATCG